MWLSLFIFMGSIWTFVYDPSNLGAEAGDDPDDDMVGSGHGTQIRGVDRESM